MPGAARVPRTRGPRAAGGAAAPARGATGDEVQAANPHEPTLSDSAAVRSSNHFFFHANECRPFALLVAPFFTSAVAPGAKLSRPRHHALGGTSLAPATARANREAGDAEAGAAASGKSTRATVSHPKASAPLAAHGASPFLSRARLRPAPLRTAPGASELGGRSCSQRSTCHRPACGPFAARLDARALRWSCARTPKSGQLVPVQRPTVQPMGDGAECARVLCCAGGAAAKAPTQRAARRIRRRMWSLGLRLDAQGGGGGGGGDRSYLCSTPSSCDGVECVFAFPAGARAIGRVGARRFDAAGVSNHDPCLQRHRRLPPGACA